MTNPPPSYELEPEQRTYVVTWTATLLLILAFVLGLILFPPLFEPFKGEVKPNTLFLGRFHPVMVHLPVGGLIVLVVMELAILFGRMEEKLGPAALLVLFLGSAGSVVAVLFGIMLSREGGYSGGSFTLHQGIGVAATAGVLLALVMRIMAMGSGHRGMMDAYRIVFFGSFGLIGLGAHFGGNMVHGNKYLTEYAPPAVAEPMKGMEKWLLSLVDKDKVEPAPAVVTPKPPAPVIEPPKTVPVVVDSTPPTTPPPQPETGGQGTGPGDDGKLVFDHLIMPILETKCNKCHNEEKSKGDLRMDTHEALLVGGEGEPGKTVIPGKPDESLAIARIKLPIDDDEHMPPEGKEQMTDEETALLHWWIQQGASKTQTVKEAQFPDATKTLVENLLKK